MKLKVSLLPSPVRDISLCLGPESTVEEVGAITHLELASDPIISTATAGFARGSQGKEGAMSKEGTTALSPIIPTAVARLTRESLFEVDTVVEVGAM